MQLQRTNEASSVCYCRLRYSPPSIKTWQKIASAKKNSNGKNPIRFLGADLYFHSRFFFRSVIIMICPDGKISRWCNKTIPSTASTSSDGVCIAQCVHTMAKKHDTVETGVRISVSISWIVIFYSLEACWRLTYAEIHVNGYALIESINFIDYMLHTAVAVHVSRVFAIAKLCIWFISEWQSSRVSVNEMICIDNHSNEGHVKNRFRNSTKLVPILSFVISDDNWKQKEKKIRIVRFKCVTWLSWLFSPFVSSPKRFSDLHVDFVKLSNQKTRMNKTGFALNGDSH